MCSPSIPTPPDPATVAQAQGTENRSTAVANANLNRVNTQTPYGNLTYTTEGTNPDGTPKYNAAVTLSPEEQNLFNLNTANQGTLAKTAQDMLGQVQDAYGTPIDTSGAPGIASSVNSRGPALAGQISNSGLPPLQSTVQQEGGTTANAIKAAQDAAYRGQTQYLDPQFQQAEDQQRVRLANQGTVQGSQAYNDAENNLALQKQRAYQGAQDAATTAGQAEQERLFGQGVSSAQLENATNQQQFGQNAAQTAVQNQANEQGFGQGLSEADLQNQARQQYISNLFSLRNQPLNEYSALSTGAQVQNPTFPSVPGANQATTNVAGINQDNYNNQLAASQQQQAYFNNLFQLGGLAPAVAFGR